MTTAARKVGLSVAFTATLKGNADISLVASFARSSKARDIPSLKLVETELSYSFLDIGPLSKGHALVIPKDHAVKMHDLPDQYLADALPIAKKIALAQGLENYNILQNNGRLAHQEVDHVHFHVIPKPIETEGLVFTPASWPAQKPAMDELKTYHAELLQKLEGLGKL